VTIAVTDRIDIDGYGPWSMKQDVLHVQPPANVLENMLSVQLHLDDCPKSNGALRVIPKSHEDGKLSQQQIETKSSQREAVTCEVLRGGALLMRPLLIHASSAAENPNHRRVIHFDYANIALDGGLRWREQQD
jgi:ectoine hydroxylase-related dioxygenase (phytanoyl-CoA dioxygenase family)